MPLRFVGPGIRGFRCDAGVTEAFDRPTDERWAEELNVTTPEDPPWVADLVAR